MNYSVKFISLPKKTKFLTCDAVHSKLITDIKNLPPPNLKRLQRCWSYGAIESSNEYKLSNPNASTVLTSYRMSQVMGSVRTYERRLARRSNKVQTMKRQIPVSRRQNLDKGKNKTTKKGLKPFNLHTTVHIDLIEFFDKSRKKE